MPDVLKYLTRKGLPFKVPLILDNAPGHPKAHEFKEEGVKVVFLPASTTSLIQPMDHGVIRTFKAHYTRHSIVHIVRYTDEHWKQFDIANAINLIDQACKDVKPASVNGCWKNPWPECVNEFAGFTPARKEFCEHVAKIMALARQVVGEGFSDLQESEVEELLEGHAEHLTDEDLEELTKSVSTEEEEESPEERTEEEEGMTLARLQVFFTTLKTLQKMVYNMDSLMVRSLKFARDFNDVSIQYRTIFDEQKRKKKQL